MKVTRANLMVAGLVLGLAVMVNGAAFGFECGGGIGDYVWLDANGNGLQDDGLGSGVNGVTVVFYELDPGVGWEAEATTVTANDANGNPGYYFFAKLGTAYFYLQFTAPTGYSWTTMDAGGDDAMDSDVDSAGQTISFYHECGELDRTRDAGLVEGFENPGVGTPGYWKTHPSAWPVGGLVIGGVFYTKTVAINIMEHPTQLDMTYSMFEHLVAAMLNVLSGNDNTVIQPYIDAGNLWLSMHPLASGVTADSDAWQDGGEDIKDMLDAYNNGLLNVPHRD